ncbi:MAG TPA: Ig-like domain-containing protein [Gemmatimonadaceae bacterium]|nr:Ig-like domain-containing protein [Gemmatimonadaceae bacterium]
MLRPRLRLLATLITGLGVAACADAPNAVTRPPVGSGGLARVAFAPVFSRAALAAAKHLADFNFDFDHVHVVIVRPPSETVADTTIAFKPGQTDVTLDLTVPSTTIGERFNVQIDYTSLAQGNVFHGQGTVESHAPDQTGAPQQIQVEYTGPGSTVARIVIAPRGGTVLSPNPLLLGLTAFDVSNKSVPVPPVNWSVSDPTLATISNTGTLTPLGNRGTLTVTALAITDATDNVSVSVILPPASISLVSGGNQSGKVGSTLSLPGVVRVSASDGVGVAGVTVNFAAPTGGKVGTPSATTDAAGLASTSLTLGGAIGPESFAAAAAGFSVSIPATATPGDFAGISAVSGGGQSDTVGHALKSPLVVKVSDAFGNAVADAIVTWTRTAGSGSVGSATSATTSAGLASMTYTLGATAGNETILASVTGVSSPASFTVQAVAATPVAIASVSGNAQGGRVSQLLAAPFVVKVTDASGNPAGGATVTWTATNGTIAATTTTDLQGLSSNTMTIGTQIGAATAVASIANGKSVTFSATVQPGTVGKVAFRNNPVTSPAGTAITPAVQVELQDAAGNLTAAANSITIALGANPSGGTLTGTLTRTSSGGVATFDDLKIDKAGVGYTLVVSSAGVVSVASQSFTVVAGAPSSLVIVAGDGQTGTVATAASLPPSVRLVDQNNNVIAGAPVTFAPVPGSGTAIPATPVVTDALGVATLGTWTFGVVAGQQAIVASSPGVPSDTIHAKVLPGPPAQLVIAAQPSTAAQSGIVFGAQPAIQLQDANGNAAPQAGVTISVALATGGGTLTGALSAITNTTGLATFTNLKVNGLIGPRTLAFTSPSLTATTSAAIALAPGAAAKLAFVAAPASGAAKITINPAIESAVQDADGNTVTTAANSVALAITTGTGTGGAVLSGTSTIAAVNGVAAFPGLSIDLAGTAYTLTTSSAGLTPAVTTAFNVTPGLVAIIPAAVDAVFVSVPVTLAGGSFAIGTTTVGVSGGNIGVANTVVHNADTLTVDFNIAGGAPTSTPNVTVTTALGTSNAFAFGLFSVGTAPLQLGAANGGGGGNAYSLDCLAGSVGTGLNVRGNVNIDQIQVVCQTVTGPTRTFGPQTTTGTAGAAGGNGPFALSCPADFVLTGLTGRIGNGGGGLNDQIAGICSPVGGGATFTTDPVGSNNANSIFYSTSCPVGLVLTGITGGAGNLVDRTQIKCR